MDTKSKGRLAQLKVEQRAAEKGITVCQPTTEEAYDLVLEDKGQFHRVQCKYADGSSSNSDGVVIAAFQKRSSGSKTNDTPYTREQIDAILVYLPRIDKTLWFGPEYFEGRTKAYIRIEPSKNGQKQNMTFASDYIW